LAIQCSFGEGWDSGYPDSTHDYPPLHGCGRIDRAFHTCEQGLALLALRLSFTFGFLHFPLFFQAFASVDSGNATLQNLKRIQRGLVFC
jgi:hypothetical protein